RYKPDQQDWRSYTQAQRPPHAQYDCSGQSAGRCGPHATERFRKTGLTLVLVLARRVPLQEPSMREKHAPCCAKNRVKTEVGFIGYASKGKQALGGVSSKGAQNFGQMLSESNIFRLLEQLEDRAAPDGNEGHRKDHQSPAPGRRQSQPTEQQQQNHGRRYQAAPEIVHDFPSRKDRERIFQGPTLRTGHARQYPAGDLPVTANPAVTPGHIGCIGRRIVFVELHIAQQTGTCITAFYKVVAENAVLRKMPTECPLKSIHVIDPFADERAFAENVLVNVRHSTRVRINARFATPETRITRAICALQTRGHTRLQDAVARGNALLCLFVDGLVERVSHCSHKLNN